MNNFLTNMLSSEGKISSKRVVTFASFALMAIGFLVDLFTDFVISENVFAAMEYIVIAGLGFTASEGFTKKRGAGATTETATEEAPADSGNV